MESETEESQKKHELVLKFDQLRLDIWRCVMGPLLSNLVSSLTRVTRFENHSSDHVEWKLNIENSCFANLMHV